MRSFAKRTPYQTVSIRCETKHSRCTEMQTEDTEISWLLFQKTSIPNCGLLAYCLKSAVELELEMIPRSQSRTLEHTCHHVGGMSFSVPVAGLAGSAQGLKSRCDTRHLVNSILSDFQGVDYLLYLLCFILPFDTSLFRGSRRFLAGRVELPFPSP